jgi:hypothetical protein
VLTATTLARKEKVLLLRGKEKVRRPTQSERCFRLTSDFLLCVSRDCGKMTRMRKSGLNQLLWKTRSKSLKYRSYGVATHRRESEQTLGKKTKKNP